MIFCCRKVIYAQGMLWCPFGTIPNIKWSSAIWQNSIFHPHFRRKYITGVAYITCCQTNITDLHSKSISLLVGHIFMPNQLKAGSLSFSKKGIDFRLCICYNIPCVQVMVHILGCRQAVRHQTLTLAFVGSNPAIPATI